MSTTENTPKNEAKEKISNDVVEITNRYGRKVIVSKELAEQMKEKREIEE